MGCDKVVVEGGDERKCCAQHVSHSFVSCNNSVVNSDCLNIHIMCAGGAISAGASHLHISFRQIHEN